MDEGFGGEYFGGFGNEYWRMRHLGMNILGVRVGINITRLHWDRPLLFLIVIVVLCWALCFWALLILEHWGLFPTKKF